MRIEGRGTFYDGRSSRPLPVAFALDLTRLSIADMAGVITPFPGGVARSGSKVGSRYKTLKASTSDPFCPTLRGRVTSKLHPEANCAYEIVIDGIDESSVGAAMKQVLHAVAGEGVVAIGAGNYGGKLGKFHYHLRSML